MAVITYLCNSKVIINILSGNTQENQHLHFFPCLGTSYVLMIKTMPANFSKTKQALCI